MKSESGRKSLGGAPGHLVGEKGGVYLLLGHLQQAGWAKGCADAEEGERGILRFPVLTVQLLDLATDVQSLQSTR